MRKFSRNTPKFRLDFLTTRHREGEKTYSHPQLGVNIQPLPFMEYSMEDVQQAVLFSGDTVVLANVPSPARYALHKLIVYGERKSAYVTKSAKDIQQAGFLLTRLKELRPADIAEAWQHLISRGPGWRSHARNGVEALSKRFPELRAKQLLTKAPGARIFHRSR